MKLIDQLILHEGLRLKPYRCTANKLTIGIGRNYEDSPLSQKEQVDLFGKPMTRAETEALLAKGITKDQAVKLLHSNIEKATQDARKLVVTFDKLSENRQNVLIDMAFNLGRSRLSQFKNTIRLINEGKFDLASQNMLKSLWAKQVKGRAVRLSIMMRDDVAYDKATKRMKR